jgi:uncharacterized protein YbjT (DUF2867 family)
MSVTSEAQPRIAVVAGASGLVGRELLRRLLREPTYARVVALTRRPLGLDHRLVEVPARYNALDEVLSPAVAGKGSVDAYCCLGTTLGTAGSEAAFREVDFDFVVAFGRWASRRPARRLVVISALGADARSRVFYNRVKGEMEDALRAIAPTTLVLVRPSLIDGERAEIRRGESLALILTRPLRGLLPASIRPVQVNDLAQAMIDAALSAAAPPVLRSAALHGAAVNAYRARRG